MKFIFLQYRKTSIEQLLVWVASRCMMSYIIPEQIVVGIVSVIDTCNCHHPIIPSIIEVSFSSRVFLDSISSFFLLLTSIIWLFALLKMIKQSMDAWKPLRVQSTKMIEVTLCTRTRMFKNNWSRSRNYCYFNSFNDIIAITWNAINLNLEISVFFGVQIISQMKNS